MYSQSNAVTEYNRGKIYAHTQKRLFASLEPKVSVFTGREFRLESYEQYVMKSNFLLKG